MKVQGTLKKENKNLFLETEDGDRYAIHSIIDSPKMDKVAEGAAIHGTVRKYEPAQLVLLGWRDRVGTVETGQLYIGALKE